MDFYSKLLLDASKICSIIRTVKIAEAILGYRKLKNRTLRQVAKEIGVPHTVLFNIENGKDETVECWPAIIRWLFSK